MFLLLVIASKRINPGEMSAEGKNRIARRYDETLSKEKKK